MKLVSIVPHRDTRWTRKLNGETWRNAKGWRENFREKKERGGTDGATRVEGLDFDVGRTFSSWLVELCRESDAVREGFAEHNATFTFSSRRRGRCTEQERPRTHWTTVLDHGPSARTSFSLHHRLLYRFSFDRTWTSRDEPRDFTWLVDRHPARFCHLLSTFSRGGQESQARASRLDALGNPGP